MLAPKLNLLFSRFRSSEGDLSVLCQLLGSDGEGGKAVLKLAHLYPRPYKDSRAHFPKHITEAQTTEELRDRSLILFPEIGLACSIYIYKKNKVRTKDLTAGGGNGSNIQMYPVEFIALPTLVTPTERLLWQDIFNLNLS